MEVTLFLFLTNVVLCILLYVQHRQSDKQISELLKAVISKNTQEFIELKRSDKKSTDKPMVDDEIPLASLDDDKWLETIERGAEPEDNQ